LSEKEAEQQNSSDRAAGRSPALVGREITPSGNIGRVSLEKPRGLLLGSLVRSNGDPRSFARELARDFCLFGRSFVCRNPFPIPHDEKNNRNNDK